MKLYLIRHAWPQRDPNTPPETWPLSPAGRDQAKAIALPWAEIDVVASSPEPKAVETARLASGKDPVTDEDLREVERPWTPGYADALKQYFHGREPRGWESRSIAVSRGLDAIRRHAEGRATVVFSHATLLTLIVAELEGVAPDFERWLDVGYAGWCEIDWPEGRIVRPFERPAEDRRR